MPWTRHAQALEQRCLVEIAVPQTFVETRPTVIAKAELRLDQSTWHEIRTQQCGVVADACQRHDKMQCCSVARGESANLRPCFIGDEAGAVPGQRPSRDGP